METSPGAGAPLDRSLLERGAAELGVALSRAALQAFERYAAELVAANRQMNLTRLTRPDEIAVQLVLDSLAGFAALPERDRPGPLACVDVGTGAGLPGLALAILRPDWPVTLVDSVGKKVAFVEHVIGLLGLPRARAVKGRAEDLGHLAEHRERYDVALARALAPMPALAEYCLPLVRTGGRLVAYKGAEVEAELADAGPAFNTLGGRLAEVRAYTLPGLDASRRLVLVEKRGSSPARYPRRAPEPRERPIGFPRGRPAD
jgi:16S rRNA (guanine527-N7)-methyltransferase